MADFMRSVEGDVRAAEEAEQAAAERFATERGEREAFEQRWVSARGWLMAFQVASWGCG
jgi:hypothetical protein